MSTPKMFVHTHFSTQALTRIAEDCGLTIPVHNDRVASAEIEFLIEAVVKDCILTILESKPEEGSTQVYNDLAKKIADKFGISM